MSERRDLRELVGSLRKWADTYGDIGGGVTAPMLRDAAYALDEFRRIGGWSFVDALAAVTSEEEQGEHRSR